MSVGFNHVITFANTGKVTDYQKSYTENYAKIIKCYLPLNFNNKKNYHAILSVAINNTYPKEIVKVDGIKSETDLNCYEFDVSEVYRQYYPTKKIGLMKITLLNDNGRAKFQSETFRA